MLKQLLVAASLVGLLGGTSFGQKRESCPNDTKEVNQRTSIDIGGVKYERDTHECKDKPGSNDRDRDRGRDRDRSRDNDKAKDKDNDRGRKN